MDTPRAVLLLQAYQKDLITRRELQDELVIIAARDADLVTREPVIAALRAITPVPTSAVATTS